MNQDEAEAREPLDADERAIVSALSQSQIDALDLAVLQEVSPRWSRVAKILGSFIEKRPGIPDYLPSEFVWERLCGLVARGDLESQGDISQWGSSEVRRVK